MDKSEIEILAALAARDIVVRHAVELRGHDWEDSKSLRDDIAAAIIAIAIRQKEEE